MVAVEMEPSQRELGRRLKALRIERDLRAADVARALGWGVENQRKYETGLNRIDLADLPRWAEALGVAPDELLRRLGLLPPTAAPPPRPSGDARLAAAVARNLGYNPGVHYAAVTDGLSDEQVEAVAVATAALIRAIRRAEGLDR